MLAQVPVECGLGRWISAAGAKGDRGRLTWELGTQSRPLEEQPSSSLSPVSVAQLLNRTKQFYFG